MDIGIVGAGHVGGTLGKRWAANGHRVIFASRNPLAAEMQKLVSETGNGSRSASPAEAAKESRVILLATPWPAAQQALESCGDLSGKIVIDAINPLLPNLDGLALGTTTSAAEQIAGWAKGASVVKALNTVGYNIMADPKFAGGAAAMFYCGDDAGAKEAVKGLIGELGFEPLDAGPLTQARLLEPFALLWISLAYPQGYGREIGFEFLRR